MFLTISAALAYAPGFRKSARAAWRLIVELSYRAFGLARRFYLLLFIGIAAIIFGEFWATTIFALQEAVSGAASGAARLVRDGREADEGLRNLGIVIAVSTTALVALATLPFAFIKAWVNERQAATAEQGHITERITKAIDHLGAEKTTYRDGEPHTEPNLEVRLGAIYALERIAQDSERDHIPIMETLSAYIRQNTNEGEAKDFPLGLHPSSRMRHKRWPRYSQQTIEVMTAARRNNWDEWLQNLGPLKKPRADVLAAFSVIGRRSLRRRMHESSIAPAFRIDLRGANLQRLDLSGIDFSGADLREIHFDGAKLAGANFVNANLLGAHMNAAQFDNARLDNADLCNTRMEGADLYQASLVSADLQRARLEEAFGFKANLRNAKLQRTKLINAELNSAQLNSAKMRRADMRNVGLNNADLSQADIRNVDFGEGDLSGCNLKKANARATNFSSVEDLSQEQINSIFGDQTTKPPNRGNDGRRIFRTDQMLRRKNDLDDDPDYATWLAAGAPEGVPVLGGDEEG